MMQKLGLVVVALLITSSCAGTRSASVIPVQSRDKQLSCREIKLEMNEAEQYKAAAEKNRNPDLRTFLAPLGYMYTVTSASEAITASEERIKYLQEVYDLSGCNAKSATGLTNEQMKGHTFTGGYPTPSPQEMQTQPYVNPQQYQQPYYPPQQQYQQAPQPAPNQSRGHTF